MSAAVAAFEFLRSPSGRAMVVRALERRGLPLALRDDLVSEILRRVVTAEARDPIDNPPGFATNAAQYAAADLLRGELRRPAPMAPVHDEDSATEPPREGAVDGVVLAALELDNLRDALLDAAMTWPSRVATALAFLVAAVDEAAVGDSCPQPAGGAGEREAAEWAGLWYGGRDDCFPLRGAKDTAAIRKRRSRAVAELQEVLVAAAERTELEEDRHA